MPSVDWKTYSLVTLQLHIQKEEWGGWEGGHKLYFWHQHMIIVTVGTYCTIGTYCKKKYDDNPVQSTPFQYNVVLVPYRTVPS
jgi:hypothetical protein